MPEARPERLKDALIDEAFAVIAESGVEGLSLREVARRLGVSHQAPYKHFASRDHILAAVVARCFAEFAAHLEARPVRSDPYEDLEEMGLAYLGYARDNPLKYRLMFNSSLPDGTEHTEMLEQAQHGFALLHERLKTMSLRDPGQVIETPAKHDAMFILSALHGFASLMQSDVLETIGLREEERPVALQRMMRRLSMALVEEGAP
jgi:AcrR family transcriptional regulator